MTKALMRDSALGLVDVTGFQLTKHNISRPWTGTDAVEMEPILPIILSLLHDLIEDGDVYLFLLQFTPCSPGERLYDAVFSNEPGTIATAVNSASPD